MSPSFSEGFRVHYFRDLDILRPIEIDDSIKLEELGKCPACTGGLRSYAMLAGRAGGKKVRLGICQECGWRGFLDRPTQKWIASFYRSEWDNAQAKNLEEFLSKPYRHWVSKAQKAVVDLAEKLEVPKDAIICDIGCGEGSMLYEFDRRGYKNLVGVENSELRARLTMGRFSYPVLTGAFESPEVVGHLKDLGGVDFFYSSHVLEHVYDPAEVIKTAAALQKRGGFLIIAVPDGENMELPSIFWLPHLHNYTRVSLERLLNKNGYAVIIDDNRFPDQIILAAKKVARPRPIFKPRSDYFALAVKTVTAPFAELDFGRRYRLCWRKKHTGVFFRRALGGRFLDRLWQPLEWFGRYLFAKLLGRFTYYRSAVVSGLKERLTDPSEAPIEIQYDDKVKLLIR